MQEGCELPDAEEPVARNCPVCRAGVLVFQYRIELWQWTDAKDPPCFTGEVVYV